MNLRYGESHLTLLVNPKYTIYNRFDVFLEILVFYLPSHIQRNLVIQPNGK